MQKKYILAGVILINSALMVSCNLTDDIEISKEDHPAILVKETRIDNLIASREDYKSRFEILQNERMADKKLVDSNSSDSKALGVLGEKEWAVATDSLNVRSDASTDSALVTSFSRGHVLEELAVVKDHTGKEWVKFQVNGQDAFVMKDYLTKKAIEKPESKYKVVVPTINVRKKASEESDIVGEMKYFEEFSVFGEEKDSQNRTWLKIKLGEGEGSYGYVLSDLCVVVD